MVRLILVVAGGFMAGLLPAFTVAAVIVSSKEDDLSSSPRNNKRRLYDGDRDISFVSQYSLRYTGCSSVPQLQNYNYKNPPLTMQHLAHFSLCPRSSSSSSSSSCIADCKGGGQYVAPLDIFIDAYTESNMNYLDYSCEMIRENCLCENANDDLVCEATCYVNAGVDKMCVGTASANATTSSSSSSNDWFLEEVDIQHYLQCRSISQNKNNRNSPAQVEYYIGPYCNMSDGQSIHLGLFTDVTCSTPALVHSSGIYRYTLGYGIDLPYATSSMIKMNDDEKCMIDCHDPDSIYTNNDVEVADACQEIYTASAKCEQTMSIISTPPDNTGCDYIQNVLPLLMSSRQSQQQHEQQPTNNRTDESTGFGGYRSPSSTSCNLFQIWTGIFAATTTLLALYIVLRDHRFHNNKCKCDMDTTARTTKEVGSGAKATTTTPQTIISTIMPSLQIDIDL